MAGGFRVSGTVKGIEKTLKAFKNLESEIYAGQVAAVRESTLMIHDYAVRSLQDNTDGPTQVRYKPKRTVNVSRPGEPPNTDKGRAVKSIKFDFQRNGMVGRVGTNLKYLADLEFGTSKIAPRPWLSRAITITAHSVAKIFADALKAATKKGKK